MKSKAIVEDLTEYVNRGITPRYTEALENSLPVINQRCIRDFHVNMELVRLNDLSKRKITEGKTLQKNDVLINSTGVGTLGRVAQFYGESGSATVDSHVTIVRPKAELVDPIYFGYLLKSKQRLIESFAAGTTGQTELARDSVKEMVLEYVSDSEKQKVIGNCFLVLDEKIQLNHQINQTLEQIAQALFKSWFVDFDPVKAKIEVLEAGGSEEEALLAAMQVISSKNAEELAAFEVERSEEYAQLRATAELFPAAMVESELGGIPEGWLCLSLDEIAHYQNGLALQRFRPEDESDFLPVVKIAQLRKGAADGEEKASPNINPACIIDNGDIIFSWSGSLIVDVWCGGKAALNQHLFKVTSEDHPKWFYYLYTKHHLAEFQRIASYKAVTMGHIKRSHLKEALCAVPKALLLNEANNKFQFILDKKIELKLESLNLSQIRDVLLPKLLSGELDVSELADSLEAET